MILESLYCGNICPADQAIPLDKEYQQLRQKILKGLEELESKLTLIIPGFFEPPVRILRAAIPENESHAFR